MLEVLWLTLRLAAATTAILLVVCAPLAWKLARTRGWWRDLVVAATATPIVLPPTVIGFYLLIALGPASPLMAVLRPFGVRSLSFTFTGLLIGSVIYSLPFALQPMRNAFAAIGREPIEAAGTLGASPFQTFFRVALPLARPGIVTAAILSFAHTVGEFGVVLMIGGSIPGRTRVVSIALFEQVEALRWREAHLLAAGLVLFAFAVLVAALIAERRLGRTDGETG